MIDPVPIATLATRPARLMYSGNVVPGRVYSIFRRVLNIVASEQVLSLAASELPFGPISVSVYLESELDWRTIVTPNIDLVLGRGTIRFVNGLTFTSTTETTVRDSRPDIGQIVGGASGLAERLQRIADSIPFIASAPIWNSSHHKIELASLSQSMLAEHARALRVSLERDPLEEVAATALAIAGLGPGLTPAGDDFLAGWMLALRHLGGRLGISQDRIEQVNKRIAHAARGRTTLLSATLLDAAASGEADERIGALLVAIANADMTEVFAAARTVLGIGHTSGMSTLAGLLAGGAAVVRTIERTRGLETAGALSQ